MRTRSEFVSDDLDCDVAVIGGGLAGVAAAIAAARNGASVTLLHNRPVLGGNSSSEVRVWVCGATAAGHQRYARETGIIGELYLENQYRNPEGNPLLWDMVVLDAVRAEPNVTLLLNTDVRELETEGPPDARTIDAVIAWTQGSERITRVTAREFIDCTGDGLVGHLAGAEYRIGRESAGDYDESWAPQQADQQLLGSTILFYTKDIGRPVRFVPPDFAKDITETSIPERRIIRSGDNGAAYWWIEWGGELDTVHDNERIRDELWSVIYGIWDHIKNSGKFDAETMTLEWVGTVPGKREYRRFVGDYTLTQNDIVERTRFEDAVGFGGWSIDLHPPGGMYADGGGAAQWYPNSTYDIPLRSLYSVNVSNLLFAGRNVSATHVAFGSTRVMATCAVMGEAAGTLAALCVANRGDPRSLATAEIALIQRTLLRQDASLIGVPYIDSSDIAQRATVEASSVCTRLEVTETNGTESLSVDIGLLVPVYPSIHGLEILVDSAEETVLESELWGTDGQNNYYPATQLRAAEIRVPAGERQWIRLPLTWEPGAPANAVVVVRANRAIRVHVADRLQPGTLSFRRRPASSGEDDHIDLASDAQHITEWATERGSRRSFTFRVIDETRAFDPAQVLGGYARPFGGPQMWVSEPNGAREALTLEWPEPVEIDRIELVFDDSVHDYMNNLHFLRTPWSVVPELVRDYEIQVREDAGWRTIVRIDSNRKRRRVHTFERTETSRIRLVVNATNGAPSAHVVAVRAYSQGDGELQSAAE